MKIKLLKLKLQNFKGIKDLEIDFKDDTTNIFGDNGTGKTTIFDAYSWLLFNRDSLNNSKFNKKTLDKNGEVIPNVEHIVEGTFLFDDKQITYKKEYKEVWTTKRGSTEEVYIGDTTDHYINEVPKSETQYKKSIAAIIDEETFKLISNPRYFNVDLDKKKRREILLAISDEVADEDIIKQNKGIKDLDLTNYTIEELQAMNKATYKKADKEIKELPVRIDELYSSIQDFDYDALEFEKKTIGPALKKIDTEIMQGDNTGALKAISEKMSELVTEQIDIKNKIDEENRKARESIETNNREVESEKQKLNTKIIELEKEISLKTELTKHNEQTVNKLRQEYEEEAKKEYNGSNICPVCSQELPHEMQAEAQDKFNLNQSKILERITVEANATKDNILKDKTEIKERETLLEAIRKDLADLESRKGQEYKATTYPARLTEIDEEISKLKEMMENAGNSNNNNELLEKKEKLQNELQEINSKLAYKEVNETAKSKIAEYETRQKELANILLDTERVLNLCDEYIKIKSELISKDINKKFNFVEFKLFEKQVNGGINEVCDATVKGVPYNDVNNAGKINAGLDIINTLSKHYDIYAPVFVDNAESVNELIDIDSQIVRLVVSEDKELKIK